MLPCRVLAVPNGSGKSAFLDVIAGERLMATDCKAGCTPYPALPTPTFSNDLEAERPGNQVPVGAHNGPTNKPTEIVVHARYTGAVKVRGIIRTVEQDGWIQVRQKGSHRQYHHPSKPGTVTVAGHPSEEVPPGTLKNIMRQAGIDK